MASKQPCSFQIVAMVQFQLNNKLFLYWHLDLLWSAHSEGKLHLIVCCAEKIIRCQIPSLSSLRAEESREIMANTSPLSLHSHSSDTPLSSHSPSLLSRLCHSSHSSLTPISLLSLLSLLSPLTPLSLPSLSSHSSLSPLTHLSLLSLLSLLINTVTPIIA